MRPLLRWRVQLQIRLEAALFVFRGPDCCAREEGLAFHVLSCERSAHLLHERFARIRVLRAREQRRQRREAIFLAGDEVGGRVLRDAKGHGAAQPLRASAASVARKPAEDRQLAPALRFAELSEQRLLRALAQLHRAGLRQIAHRARAEHVEHPRVRVGVALARDGVERAFGERSRIDLGFTHGLEQASKHHSAKQRILDRGRVREHPLAALRVRKELRIRDVTRVGDDAGDALGAHELVHLRFCAVAFDADGAHRTACSDDEQLDAQRPRALAVDRFLHDARRGNAAVRSAFPCDAHARQRRRQQPAIGPARQVGLRSLLQCVREVAPRCVAEAVLRQEPMDAIAERRAAEPVIEFAQHRRRLVVDDRPIGRLRVREVGEFLEHRNGPRCCVDFVGARLHALHEAQPRLLLRFEHGHRLVRDECREAFLEPEVVKPPHRHEVAEPLVAQFVVDERAASREFAGRRFVVEAQRLLAIEDRARVFHAAVGEPRQQDDIELLERVWLAEVAA